MNDKAPLMARRAGLARHLALEHNPLRRRADRLQTFIMAGLLAAFLAGRPSWRSPPATGPRQETCGSSAPSGRGIRFPRSCCKPRRVSRGSGTRPR